MGRDIGNPDAYLHEVAQAHKLICRFLAGDTSVAVIVARQ
jgi:hypothetical protein